MCHGEKYQRKRTEPGLGWSAKQGSGCPPVVRAPVPRGASSFFLRVSGRLCVKKNIPTEDKAGLMKVVGSEGVQLSRSFGGEMKSHCQRA